MALPVVSSSCEPESEISAANVQKLSSDLRPLMFWMSNATELLNFFQVKVEHMEKEWEFEGEKPRENEIRWPPQEHPMKRKRVCALVQSLRLTLLLENRNKYLPYHSFMVENSCEMIYRVLFFNVQ